MSVIEDNSFSRLLRITNEDSVNPTDTISDFTINLNRMIETNNIVRIVVKSVSFMNNAYNVYTSGELKNNTFEYEVKGAGTFTEDLPVDGFYTTKNILDILQPVILAQLQLVDGGATLSMELDEITNKVKITLTGGAVLILNGATGDGSLNRFLGNTVDSGDITGTYYLDRMADLQGLTKVYIHSLEMGEGNLVDGDVEVHDVISEIPVQVPFGTLVSYESNDDELDSVNYASVRNFDSINISLRNDKDINIPLNGGELTVILKMYYI